MNTPSPQARLLDLLDHPDHGVQNAAASVLDALHTDGDLAWLSRLLDSPEPVVHAFAAHALSRAPLATEALRRLLDHPDHRRAILDALRRHPHPDLFPQLVDLLGHADPHTRHLAAHALTARPLPEDLDRRLLAHLADDLEAPTAHLRHDAHALLMAHLLMAPERAVALLDHPSGHARALALDTLAAEAPDLLDGAAITALADPVPAVRAAAARACATLNLEDARDALLDCLDEAEPEVFAEALDALSRLGSPDDHDTPPEDVLDALEAFTRSPAAPVADAGLDALCALDPERAIVAARRRCAPPDARADHAIAVLRLLGTPSATGALLELLDHPAEAVRGQAAHALGVLRAHEATPRLIALLDITRQNTDDAAWALGQLAAEDGIAPLIAAFDGDTDDEAIFGRDQIIEALARMPEASVVPQLVKALTHPGWWVYTGAVEALGTLGTPAAIGALIDALQHTEPQVREYAARILGIVGDPSVVPALAGALDDPWPGTRVSALESLAQLGTLSAPVRDALADRLLSGAADERVFAAEALGATRHPDALRPLLDTLDDADPELRVAALLALAHLDADVPISALAALLDDPDVGVRDAAAVSLGQLARPEAIPALLDALANPASQVQRAAAEALINLLGAAERA